MRNAAWATDGIEPRNIRAVSSAIFSGSVHERKGRWYLKHGGHLTWIDANEIVKPAVRKLEQVLLATIARLLPKECQGAGTVLVNPTREPSAQNMGNFQWLVESKLGSRP